MKCATSSCTCFMCVDMKTDAEKKTHESYAQEFLPILHQTIAAPRTQVSPLQSQPTASVGENHKTGTHSLVVRKCRDGTRLNAASLMICRNRAHEWIWTVLGCALQQFIFLPRSEARNIVRCAISVCVPVENERGKKKKEK
jgi:hypothetical protein